MLDHARDFGLSAPARATRREQAATQRKLDELLRATPDAETGLILLEEASDDEMRDVESDLRDSKRNETTSSGSDRSPPEPPPPQRVPSARG